MDDADAAIEAVREDRPAFADNSITMAVEYNNGLQFFNPTGSTAEEIFTDMGFDPSPEADRFVEDNVVSNENLAMLESDVLVTVYENAETRDDFEDSGVYSALGAIDGNRYVSLIPDEDDVYIMINAEGEELENPTWAFRRGASSLSIPWALDVLANQWCAHLELDDE